MARKKLDFASALKGVADNFGIADQWAVENARRRRRVKEDNVSTGCHYTSRLRWIRQWYMSKTGQDEPQLMDAQAGDDDQMGMQNIVLPDVRMDFEFWPDLMSVSALDMQSFPGNSWSGL